MLSTSLVRLIYDASEAFPSRGRSSPGHCFPLFVLTMCSQTGRVKHVFGSWPVSTCLAEVCGFFVSGFYLYFAEAFRLIGFCS